ncbi:DUF6221 family protein [Streptomyces sp. NPDC093223]|uniref:DUF6221 family protein n=1 Tax=Streptomyces sp. NPDC093223 TaxID=3366033 RepID=UPI0037F3752A
MEDLVRWLGEQLDEDERIANEAGGHRAEWRLATPLDDAELGDASWLRPPELKHAERHDPARVLREIDAKRQLVECHEPWTASNGDVICGRCGREHIDGRPGGHFPCQTLRLLALPYADRPGYLDAWRP